MSAGTECLAPGEPTVPPPPPPPPAVSRYRSLRGKSVSSLRPSKTFDVFKDADGSPSPRASRTSSDLRREGSSSTLSSSVRRRSKTIAAAPTRLDLLALTPSPTGGGLAPKAAVGAVGSVARQVARHAPIPPPIIIAPPSDQDDPVPDPGAAQPPSPAPTVPTALSPKPINVPSSIRRVKSEDTFKSRLLPSDIARLKSLNDLAFRKNTKNTKNTKSTDRVALFGRDEDARRRQEEKEAARWADEVARLEAETDRILAEQKKRDAVRARSQLITPTKSRHLLLEKFTFLSRGRRSNASSQAGSPSPTATTVFSLDFSRSSSTEDPFSPSPDRMSFIEQGGRGIVPQTDAPVTASNGGERRVTVRCQSSTINLPVTPDTTPRDILYSTANLTSHDIDPEASVIIECYVELGLERRLRRYERIRDIMNSWDRDQQNSLLVLTSDISENHSDLDIKSVPVTDQAPPGFSLHLYHSSRPGKWNKRWVTLLETGQMFASKKPDAKPHDKDSTAICHLSDFDIYTPRESEARRHLKAPKRFCYAIKSQQKTIVFPNGENFVHFFCSEDRQLAHRFQELVQGWRSWYLVNKKVDLVKQEKAPQIVSRAGTVKKGISKSKSVVQDGRHKLQVSVDETPYTIGAFQPLLDLERFNKPIEEFGKDFIEVKPAPPQEPKQTPKSKVLTKSQAPAPTTPQTPASDEEFSPGGLLGNKYEEKRKLSDRPASETVKPDGPFTQGPSLLNGGGGVNPPTASDRPEPQSWFPSAAEHSTRTRSRSTRVPRRPGPSEMAGKQKPQPLLNLANNFPEPPRAWREGQGHGHRAPNGGGPLINFATGGAAPGLMRSNTRAGASFATGPPPMSGASIGHRPRSRSTAGMQPPPGRRYDETPPVPPLPNRSMRRERTQPLEPSRGRDPRPREPLINRAGTSGSMRY